MGSPIISWPMATSYFTGSPSAVRDVSYSITGTKGSTTYFYWVVANYSWGSVSPRAPLIVANGPDVLGVTGSIVLSWLQPSTQIVNYSVLRTTTNQFPGSSTTAVIVNTTNTTVTDSGAALVAFTFTAIPAMKGVIYIDGTGPTPVLISNIGMQVAGSISATSFGTVGAVEGTVAGWRAYTVTLVGTNWQITGPDGTVTLVPTAAALTQDIPLGTLSANAFVTDSRWIDIAGPSGGVTTAVIQAMGNTANPLLYASAQNFSLQVTPSNVTFLDFGVSQVGNDIINTPTTLTVRVVTTGGNINAITPPCSFVIAIFWGVTN